MNTESTRVSAGNKHRTGATLEAENHPANRQARYSEPLCEDVISECNRKPSESPICTFMKSNICRQVQKARNYNIRINSKEVMQNWLRREKLSHATVIVVVPQPKRWVRVVLGRAGRVVGVVLRSPRRPGDPTPCDTPNTAETPIRFRFGLVQSTPTKTETTPARNADLATRMRRS